MEPKPKQTDTMTLWSSVAETDPSMTKRVNQRGGFTSICAQYQVMRATQQWGPCGDRWGYSVVYSTLCGKTAVLIFADVTLWFPGEHERAGFGPIRGCNILVDEKGRIDDDAPKKALTDGLTKGLSQLGFSADVFLGKFDDNKYVATLETKYNTHASRSELSPQDEAAMDHNGEQEPAF